jgi:ribosomal protein S18 acetylase RimI-like enzyme
MRLRALRDAPDAFATKVEEVEDRPSEWWSRRLASSHAATFVAVSEGRDIGLVVGAPFQGRVNTAGLFAMWVEPEMRGSGVADSLVGAVVDWARAAGFRRLVLEVADENVAAIRLYERNGFIATGATSSLPLPRTHVREHERELHL